MARPCNTYNYLFYVVAFMVGEISYQPTLVCCEKPNPCPIYSFSPDGTKENCTPCSSCSAGYGVVRQCSATSDIVCERCPPGSYNQWLTDVKPCRRCCKCKVEARGCNPDRDAECAECEVGQYLDWRTRKCLNCSFCYPYVPYIRVGACKQNGMDADYQCVELMAPGYLSAYARKDALFQDPSTTAKPEETNVRKDVLSHNSRTTVPTSSSAVAASSDKQMAVYNKRRWIMMVLMISSMFSAISLVVALCFCMRNINCGKKRRSQEYSIYDSEYIFATRHARRHGMNDAVLESDTFHPLIEMPDDIRMDEEREVHRIILVSHTSNLNEVGNLQLDQQVFREPSYTTGSLKRKFPASKGFMAGNLRISKSHPYLFTDGLGKDTCGKNKAWSTAKLSDSLDELHVSPLMCTHTLRMAQPCNSTSDLKIILNSPEDREVFVVRNSSLRSKKRKNTHRQRSRSQSNRNSYSDAVSLDSLVRSMSCRKFDSIECLNSAKN